MTELTPQEKLALTGFEKAFSLVKVPVSPGDAYLALSLLDDPDLSLIAGNSLDMRSYAEALKRKGHLQEVGSDRYRPKIIE